MSSRGAMSEAREAARAALGAWLADTGVEHSPGARPGELVVRLPGEHRLHTTVSVLLGEHSLAVSAFVVRHPEENRAAVMRWLLRRNARLPGVAFALDREGDVYLVGRLPIGAVTERTIDALLGAVLETADGAFDELLRLGFASAIRREARWRQARGLGTANLAAFPDLAGPEVAGPEGVWPGGAGPEVAGPEVAGPEGVRLEGAGPEDAAPGGVRPGDAEPGDAGPEGVRPEDAAPESAGPESAGGSTPPNAPPDRPHGPAGRD